MTNVFIIESMALIDGENISSQTLGVYSSEEKANKELEKLKDSKSVIYSIAVIKLDAPIINNADLESIEENLKIMMDQGIVDQLVGEDGNFYYTLTDEYLNELNKRKEKEDNQ